MVFEPASKENMEMRYLYSFIVLVYLCACESHTVQKAAIPREVNKTAVVVKSKGKCARLLDSLGYINVADADSTIAVRLMYAYPDNFTKRVLYKDLKEAYLHPRAMKGLLKAQRELKRLHPQYRLIIYDAARPMSIQKIMWNVVKGTKKDIYVSNPRHGGGLHNYGLAVDISILDASGKPLPMGTHVDFMGKASHIDNEWGLVKNGTITNQERENRALLRRVMTKGGFKPLRTEWWHFNYCSRKVAKKRYKVIP
jgi:D-alanyl-D-alanine dipeptidase